MSQASDQVSYRINKVSTNVEAEIKRLKAQVELFWDKEIKTYRNFGLTDGMKILECGSGPGFLMEKLISNFPNCHVVGVETDPFLVETSKKYLQDIGVNKYEVVQQSIMEMNFPDDSFDFIITRLVLEHLPNSLGAAKEVYRVLRPGGKAVFIDNDFEIHLKTYPDIPELSQLYAAYCQARIEEGGNPKIGRELPGLLKKSQFKNVDLEIVVAHNEVVGDDIFLKSEGAGIPAKLVEDGYLSRDLLDTIASKWFEMLQVEDHAIFRQLFIAGGTKASTPEKIAPQVPKQKTRSESGFGFKNISNLEADERLKALEDYVQKLVADALHISKSEVLPNIPVIELGLDSLMAVQLKNNIKSDLAIDISVIDFFENESISDIAQTLLDKSSKDGRSESSISKGESTEICKKLDNQEIEWDEGEL